MLFFLALAVLVSSSSVSISNSRPGSFSDTTEVNEADLKFGSRGVISKAVVDKVGVGQDSGVPVWGWPPMFSFDRANKVAVGSSEKDKKENEENGRDDDILRQIMKGDEIDAQEERNKILRQIPGIKQALASTHNNDEENGDTKQKSPIDSISDPPADLFRADTGLDVNDMKSVLMMGKDDDFDELKNEPVWSPSTDVRLVSNPVLKAKDEEAQIQLHDAEINNQIANLLPATGTLPPDQQGPEIQFVGITQPHIQFAAVPFYGPFASDAVLSLNVINQRYSLLQGLEPSEVVKFVQGATDPDQWADATIEPITCSEHSYHSPTLSSPGGDLAEFVMSLQVYQEMLARRIGDDGEPMKPDGPTTTFGTVDVFRVLVEYLASTDKRGFHVCVNSQFLSGLCSRTRFCALDTKSLIDAPADMTPQLLSHLGYSDTLPSRQLFAMFNYEDMQTTPELVAAAVRAVFALVWNIPLDTSLSDELIFAARAKVQLAVFRQMNVQSAILKIHTDGRCPTSFTPRVATATHTTHGAGHVIHPEALNVHRIMLARFIANRYDDKMGLETSTTNKPVQSLMNMPPSVQATQPVFLQFDQSDDDDRDYDEMDAAWPHNQEEEEDEATKDEPQQQEQQEQEHTTDTSTTAIHATNDIDITDQPKKIKPQLMSDTDVAQRARNGYSQSPASSISAIHEKSVDQSNVVSLRLRKLASTQHTITTSKYLSHLPVYHIVFTPTSVMDPCAFHHPFNLPFLDQGPFTEYAANSSLEAVSKLPRPESQSQSTQSQQVMFKVVPHQLEPKQRVMALVNGLSLEQVQSYLTTITILRPRIINTPEPNSVVISLPPQFTWVRSRFTSLGPFDGRVKEPVIGAPGADIGQWIIALSAFERTSKRHLSQREVDQAFKHLLLSTERHAFTMWIDTTALDELCRLSHACPVFDPSHDTGESMNERLSMVLGSIFSPPSDALMRLREHCSDPSAVGDRFLRWVLQGDSLRIRSELAVFAIRAFYGVLWNFMPDVLDQAMSAIEHAQIRAKLDLVVMNGPPGSESAILTVNQSPACYHGVQPAFSPSNNEVTMCVHHAVVSKMVRDHFLESILSQHTSLHGTTAALRIACHELADKVTKRFINEKLSAKPHYIVTMSGLECYDPNL